MRPLPAVLALAAASIFAGAAFAAASGLEAYRWKARPLVVVAPDSADPRFRSQMEAVKAAAAGLKERDMVVLTGLGADDPLRQRFGGEAGFQVVLVGKDGHIAGRWDRPVALADIFALIDRMPMRQDEMRRQQK